MLLPVLLASTGALPSQPPLASLQVTDTCAAESTLSAFKDVLCDNHGNLSIPTSFGRSADGSCACRQCGSSTYAVPEATDTATASLCQTTYPAPPTILFDSDGNVVERCQDAGNYYCMITMRGDPDEARRLEAQEKITSCLTPDRTSADMPSATMFVIGDSFSGAVSPALSLAARGRYQVRNVFISGFGMLAANSSDLIAWMRENDQDAGANLMVTLSEFTKNFLKANMQAGDLLVVGELPPQMLDAGGHGPTRREGWPELRSTYGAIERLETDFLHGVVEPAGAKMLVLGPYNSSQASVNRQAQAWEGLQAFQSRNPFYVTAVNLYSHFCDAELPTTSTFADLSDEHSNTTRLPECTRYLHPQPGVTIEAFHDVQHLNNAGAIYLWPHLCAAMTQAALMD